MGDFLLLLLVGESQFSACVGETGVSAVVEPSIHPWQMMAFFCTDGGYLGMQLHTILFLPAINSREQVGSAL